ncbi:uncharacterized protein TNCV_732901 [Trichonephila clavipes]|nr:uncharacterized protein TNCV_732901 [Trichonephila clavipes]
MGRTLTRFKQHRVTTTSPMNCYAVSTSYDAPDIISGCIPLHHGQNPYKIQTAPSYYYKTDELLRCFNKITTLQTFFFSLPSGRGQPFVTRSPNRISKECGCVGFNGPDGRQGYVLALQSGSCSKLGKESFSTAEEMPGPVFGNRIVDLELIVEAFAQLCCPKCFAEKVELFEDSRYGLCSHFTLKCKGFAGAFKFCSTLNLPRLTKTAYKNQEAKLLKVVQVVQEVAEESMIKAATEIVEKQQNLSSDIVKCGISVDGTWQRRGYTSMNGCVAAISVDTGKVLDIEVMSSYCPTCKRLQTMPRNFEYESLKADHICQCNFTGSSSKMEIVAASRIFLRSEKNRRLQYTQYYGDGDSKAFMSVKDTYGLNSVTKFECIGHVQKRVGSRLRKLKTKTKGLSGKGKLTDNFIDRLQNYYGIAVRSNVGNLTAMQQNVIAALYHCASSDKKPMHGQCPIGKESWCYFQRGVANGTKCFTKYAGLSNDVLNKIKPVYLELCDKQILSEDKSNDCVKLAHSTGENGTIAVNLKNLLLAHFYE